MGLFAQMHYSSAATKQLVFAFGITQPCRKTNALCFCLALSLEKSMFSESAYTLTFLLFDAKDTSALVLVICINL